MTISAIVAASQNRVIGKDNQIPWHLPEDLKFFKRTTLGHHIIMGRKNYESIGRPLPKRTNIIVTRNPFYISSGCLVTHSIEEALQVALKNGDDEAFIIGGGEIYAQSMNLLDKIYYTEVEAEVDGDVFFPEIDPSIWKEVSSEYFPSDERHIYSMHFKVFERL